MSRSLNYYDYKLLVEHTINNYYGNIGKILPKSFSSLERIFFTDLLRNYNVGQNNMTTDKTGNLILNVDLVITNMTNYRNIHQCKYNGRLVYNLKLDFSTISRTYNKLRNIFNFGYDRTMNYSTGIQSIKNYLEIWDQTYINSESDNLTSILFLFDPKGKTDITEYEIPVVLFDLRLGSFLGIPPKYWITIKQFVLDCRSNLFLEIMKHWQDILVKISDCPDHSKYYKCSRVYTRTKRKMPIWGDCNEFRQKIETIEPDTIHFRNNPNWERQNQNFKINSNC